MTIVYIYAKGKSAAGDFELRHSLRSIDKFATGVDRVVVVGYCPEWLSDTIVKVPYCDGMPCGNGNGMGKKMRNIMMNCVRAFDMVPDMQECLVSMDDHFYINKVDFDNYPYFVRDYLDKSWRATLPYGVLTNQYFALLSQTRQYLESRGLPVLNFAIHRNMHVKRSVIDECRGEIEKMSEWRSPAIECFAWWNNILLSSGEIVPTIVEDVKIYGISEFEEKIKNTDVFSIADISQDSAMYKIIEKIYPEKSKYEL